MAGDRGPRGAVDLAVGGYAGHSPEKILLWSGPQQVSGLWFATRYDSRRWDDGVGEPAAEVDIGNITVGEPIPLADFSAPR